MLKHLVNRKILLIFELSETIKVVADTNIKVRRAGVRPRSKSRAGRFFINIKKIIINEINKQIKKIGRHFRVGIHYLLYKSTYNATNNGNTMVADRVEIMKDGGKTLE